MYTDTHTHVTEIVISILSHFFTKLNIQYEIWVIGNPYNKSLIFLSNSSYWQKYEYPNDFSFLSQIKCFSYIINKLTMFYSDQKTLRSDHKVL